MIQTKKSRYKKKIQSFQSAINNFLKLFTHRGHSFQSRHGELLDTKRLQNGDFCYSNTLQFILNLTLESFISSNWRNWEHSKKRNRFLECGQTLCNSGRHLVLPGLLLYSTSDVQNLNFPLFCNVFARGVRYPKENTR